MIILRPGHAWLSDESQQAAVVGANIVFRHAPKIGKGPGLRKHLELMRDWVVSRPSLVRGQFQQDVNGVDGSGRGCWPKLEVETEWRRKCFLTAGSVPKQCAQC